MHTTTDFTYDRDYNFAYAETDDPRVLAIIRRDDWADGPDGDSFPPAYWMNYSLSGGYLESPHPAGNTFEDAESRWIAERFAYATRQLNNDITIARYMRVFHNTRVYQIKTTRSQDSDLFIFDTPTWRAHVGEPDSEQLWTTPADEWFAGEAHEWRAYLDGDVWGIGYAVNPARVTTETPVADCLDDFEQTIECWGFYGHDYAEQSAAAFEAEEPDLPTMLPLAS